MRRFALTFLLLLAPLTAHAKPQAPAHASVKKSGPAEVAISRPRITIGDVLPKVPENLAVIDLGPSPAPGGSRLVTRDEMKKVFDEAKLIAPSLPESVRVIRKMKAIDASKLEQSLKTNLTMPRGVQLAAVRAPRTTEVADGWDAVTAEMPKPKRSKGKQTTNVTLTFMQGKEALAKITVPVDLFLTDEATIPDVSKGAALKLVITRGLVEISAPATAGADGDVGEIIPITVRTSGRNIRARLVDKEHATAISEGS